MCWKSFQSHQYCSQFRFAVLIWFILFFCFLFQTSVYANTETTSCHANIIQSQVAKAVGINGIQRPQKGWINIQHFPDYIESRWQGYSGSVWYKIRWHYVCSQPQKIPITLVINNINMAGQIYLNHELLWQDQRLVEPLSRSWNMPCYWNLPASSLKQGENVLWIRVIGVKTQASGLGKVILDIPDRAIPLYQDFWFRQQTLGFFNFIFSLTLGLISLLVWLFYREDKVFGWFALSALAWVLIIGNTLIVTPPFGLETLQIARINIIAIFAYSVFSYLYAWRFAQQKFPRIEKVLYLLLGCIILFGVFLPDSVLAAYFSIGFITAILLLLLNFISYPFIAYCSKKTEAYLLAAVFLIYIVVIVHDSLSLFKTGNPFSWTPYTSSLETLLVATILAMRQSNNLRRIARFNRILEERVVQAKNELATSLNTQHQLELENTKLQERIHLAHDLHDGLGSSLVRSMALIGQSKSNLSNQQFLSMLKLLRDDLRQIIDNGSSAGAKVPETPTLWVAPIRYRFVQIFDELDIHSSWQVPEYWRIQPSSLQCLTLLRVIEEALTNTIKHSQAKNVSIRLHWNAQHLILEIEDDGIGFDPNHVQRDLHVGLQSMCIRMKRIGGDFEIFSKSGQTKIKASLSN